MKMYRHAMRLYPAAAASLLFSSFSCKPQVSQANFRPELLTFSRVDRAHALNRGAGATVAVIDWQFDPEGTAASQYVHATSLVEGEEIGKLKPWHGAWMVEIVHNVAPEARIMPIVGRGKKDGSYQASLVAGIRYAAERGAVSVSNSMGPVDQTEELRAAIDFAESRGTVFVDVHPENSGAGPDAFTPCTATTCDTRIVHAGIVSAPEHPTRVDAARQVYTWPYDLKARFRDGWGFSNAPPTIAGVIALMKSANPALTPDKLRKLLQQTAYDHEGFKVVDAEAAVRAALEAR